MAIDDADLESLMTGIESAAQREIERRRQRPWTEDGVTKESDRLTNMVIKAARRAWADSYSSIIEGAFPGLRGSTPSDGRAGVMRSIAGTLLGSEWQWDVLESLDGGEPQFFITGYKPRLTVVPK